MKRRVAMSASDFQTPSQTRYEPRNGCTNERRAGRRNFDLPYQPVLDGAVMVTVKIAWFNPDDPDAFAATGGWQSFRALVYQRSAAQPAIYIALPRRHAHLPAILRPWGVRL